MADDNSASYFRCAVCGVEGNFCGYHNIGPEKVSLCVACAESPVEVYRVTMGGSNQTPSLYVEDPNAVLSMMHTLMERMEPKETILIEKRVRTYLKLFQMPQFLWE